MNNIHPTAILESGARISKEVRVGPYCVIGSEVEIEDRVELQSHVVITGKTKIGAGTKIYPFASIGQTPQILKNPGDSNKLIVGTNNIIREYVTIQSGSADGGGLTRVGDNCLLMVGVHIAHDCIVGNRVVIANYSSLAGHVQVGDGAIIGGLSAVHQFVRIGSYAMLGGASALARDLIPFGIAKNERARLEGLNLVGLKRNNFQKEHIVEALRAIHHFRTSDDNFDDRIQKLSRSLDNDIIKSIIEFLNSKSKRSFLC
ncbi:Acyl-[acyl-carrier-protein]--UDP-N-acetylglucosamine O-acyltransferase [Rickettsiales endosymbiont of Paramecium tredecaurelia]|uniref:acyl-ACP--UDP-N-acetylglucosamine O-acyltransferase n=1 Tax=Candidatus Sarmatiella mevalonica TaxID=2770581 RepID=UPI0019220F62|nr:acyl-ACP--UDP-N-acetylglucosamine O-acyltransferase [Candidatus Sarmatiella mevalonica]MBL3285158.1 Acyl-[acyl-carrier-protein]--UDP-N-acetylglucosamine O-acyltransferase [Candidatus Sarmatiella mevalonica]